MNRKPISLAAIVGAALWTSACASPATQADPDVERPSPSSPLTGDLARSLNDAGLAIFRAAAAKDQNTAISPFSIGLAFGMLDAGATGTVESALDGFFAFPGVGVDRLTAFNALEQGATRDASAFPAPADDEAPRHATVTTANRLFLDDGFAPLDVYRDNMARYFGAGATETPMSSNPEKAAKAINAWVEEKTNGLIPELVSPGAFDAHSRLTLVNALYLKADWAVPFEADNTSTEPFTRLDGTAVDVDMMHSGRRGGMVYEGEDALAVTLPYAYDELSMTVIVPADGRLEEVRDGLNQDWLDGVQAASKQVDYTLALPVFTAESRTDLRAVMEGDLGVDGLFGQVGLDGIGPDLYVSGAVHAATVTVDERGTEAAAATAIMVGGTSMPADEPIEIRADHPFLYVITDGATGALLFVGQVLDPS